MLEKPGGVLQKKVGADSLVPGAWLYADTKQGPQALSPGGGAAQREREREREAFLSVKLLIFLQDSLGQSCPAGLVASSQQARHKQGG